MSIICIGVPCGKDENYGIVKTGYTFPSFDGSFSCPIKADNFMYYSSEDMVLRIFFPLKMTYFPNINAFSLAQIYPKIFFGRASFGCAIGEGGGWIVGVRVGKTEAVGDGESDGIGEGFGETIVFVELVVVFGQ